MIEKFYRRIKVWWLNVKVWWLNVKTKQYNKKYITGYKFAVTMLESKEMCSQELKAYCQCAEDLGNYSSFDAGIEDALGDMK